MSNIHYDNAVTKKRIVSVDSGAISVLILNTVEVISGVDDKQYAFFKCSKTISTIDIEEGSQLKVIEPYAFYNCKQIKNLNLQKCTNLARILESAFNGTALGTVSLPSESLTYLGASSFASSGLSTIYIPKLVEYVGSKCFYGTLNSITFDPASKCRELGSYCFRASKIQSITLPAALETHGWGCFEDCKQLTEILVQKGNTHFSSSKGVLYNLGMTTAFTCPAGKTGDLTIESTTITVSSTCFINSRLSVINVPFGVQKIQNYGFARSAIRSMTLPDSVVTIGDSIFEGCTLLSSITFSKKITGIPPYAFMYTAFTQIEIPEGITSINGSAFRECPNLKLIILPSTLNYLGGGVFKGCRSDLVIKFNDQTDLFIDNQFILMNKAKTSVKQYLGSDERANITIEDSVTEILTSAFSGSKIASITFSPNSKLETIGGESFAYCKLLTGIDIPSKVTYIGRTAFEGCQKLATVTLPSTLATVDDFAFKSSGITSIDFSQTQVTVFKQGIIQSCKMLESISLPPQLESIGRDCFHECTLLKEIEFPSSFSSFARDAFMKSGIQEIRILEVSSLTTICDYAFNEAYQLTTFVIPPSVTLIGYMAFYKTNITTISIPVKCTEIKGYCFSNCESLDSFIVADNSQLKTLGLSVFEGAVSLRQITCKDNLYYMVENGALFNHERTELIVFPPKSSIRFFSFPEYVRTVSTSSFFGCNNLIQVMIPDKSITSIGDRAFMNCANLEMINIPGKVTIGKDVFAGCKKLVCGVKVDFEETRNTLVSKGGLRLSVFSSCTNMKTCENKQTRTHSNLAISLILFLCVE